MTVQELKDCFTKFNVKTKSDIPGERIVTIDDIIKGNTFQKFIDNNNFTRVVSGLKVIDGNICYAYPVLDRIEIDTEENFPPCGGKEELNVYAYYTIHGFWTDGHESLISEERHSIIQALITLDNSLFSYEKPYLINNAPNNSDSTIELNIYAAYYNKSVKYETIKKIIQNVNKHTTWLVEKEPTDYIKLSLDYDILPKEGGMVHATVERHFSRLYYMKDSCGNVVGEKNEPGLTEDITDKCLITCNNRKDASILKNVIKVNQQELGAKEKIIQITAKYLDFASTSEIYQEEGGKIEYQKELSFENGKNINFIDFESSVPTKKVIQIISKTHKYVDESYAGFVLNYDLTFSYSEQWVYAKVIKDDECVIIECITTDTNIDKINDREACITISNGEKQIKLIVSQPALNVIDENYGYEYIGQNYFSCDELKNDKLYIKPYKFLTYENGYVEHIDIGPNIKVSATCTSSNSELLKLSSLDEKDDLYYLNFTNFACESISDIELKITPIFYNGKDLVFKGDNILITVEGKKIIDYNYELCFDGHNKFKTVKWNNSSSSEIINYNSFKYTLVNGDIVNKEIIPVKISTYDDDNKEFADDSFSVKLLSDKIVAFPIKTNENVERKYVITQKETNKKIDMKLCYENSEMSRSIPLKVIVYCENVDKDIWTGENGYLLIDENIAIKLTPCWLSPTMKDKKDTAYNGIITIKEGEHKFEAVNVILLTQKGEYTKIDCKKTIDVNSSTKEILFEIKCP